MKNFTQNKIHTHVIENKGELVNLLIYSHF